MEWLQTALDRVGERFRTAEEYPLIDDAEMLSQKVVSDFWPWAYGHSGASADRLLESALTSDHDDLPVRFVYLNLFYRLAHYAADDFAIIVQDRDEAPEHRDLFLGYLKTLVGLTKGEINAWEDPRRIRWEISNACGAQDWDLAGSLYRRLEDLAETDQLPHILAMHGRHEALTVFAHPWGMDNLGLGLWAPIQKGKMAADLRILLLLHSMDTCEDPAVSLSSDEKSRTEDAAHHLGKAVKAIRGKLDADLLYRLLLLRCRLALGSFRDAAADCEGLLKRRSEIAKGCWGPLEESIVFGLYTMAVDAYESDGQIDRAIIASEALVKEFPDAQGIHECRARLFQKQGDLDAAYDSLRKEVARNPHRGDNPAVSMAIRFGELYGAPEARWKRFQRNLDPSEVDLVRSLVFIHWPAALGLNDHNLKDWVFACCALVKHPLDDPSLPVFCFGRLIENELHTRIFERFRREEGAEIFSLTSSSAEKDPLTDYLSRGDRGLSLEQMLNEIRHPKPRSMAGRRFREWLGREKNTGLLKRIDLAHLGDLNNRAKHPREAEPLLTWEDAEEMARLSRELLDVILSM